MIKTKLLFISAILMIAGCQSGENERSGKFKTMMLKATGEVETLPDEASFNIRLSCLNRSIQLSKECLVEKSNELTASLLQMGIDQDDILTTGVEMDKSYTWNRNTRVFQGYQSSTTLYVTVKALDNLDEIYTELLTDKNLEIGGLSYNHSQMDSLKNEAYLDALKKSQLLADKLLTGLPASSKEILKIGNVEISSSLPEMRESVNEEMEMVSDAVAKRSIAVNRGTVSIRATLYVEFLIE